MVFTLSNVVCVISYAVLYYSSRYIRLGPLASQSTPRTLGPFEKGLRMKPFFDGGGRGVPDRDTPIASSQSRPGWARYVPVVLFPATGPSHCAAPASALHPAGRRQESRYLCGNLVFGPPYLTRRPDLFHARWIRLFSAVHPAHGASWAGLAVVRCETQTRPMRRTGERCRSEWRVLASVIVGERPRASLEPSLDPLSPLRCPSQCEASHRPTGAERGRISVAGRISAVSGASQRPPGFAGCS